MIAAPDPALSTALVIVCRQAGLEVVAGSSDAVERVVCRSKHFAGVVPPDRPAAVELAGRVTRARLV